ncbi:MAG: ATP-binding protein [Velocimicrobium sp.]
MELKIKGRTVKLRTIFIRYLSMFCFGTILWALILIFFYSVFASSGMLYPANYAEQQLGKTKDVIVSSEIISPELIPNLCDYAVYTPNGAILSGNLNQYDAKKAWNRVLTCEKSQDLFYNYMKISKKDQVCVIRYSLSPQYKSPVLRKYLPKIEPLTFLIFMVGFILSTFILASIFGRKLTQKMGSLQYTTEKIQNQELEFTVESSGVLEIDDVLRSMEKMKDALKESLKRQWDLEQTRREQMSALAHDIKTPITIVRGNVDLLSETNQTEEQKEYITYIEESTHQMEQYIKTLIEISKAEAGYFLRKEPIDSKNFMENISNQIDAVVAVKKMTLNFETSNAPTFFYADYGLLQRAILNLVSNAVEFSSKNGKIIFKMESAQNHIRFCVVDYGKGFSAVDLKQATQQFYMGDKSRTSNTHYGMGLFIANSIAIQHGGTLSIANSEVTGGGIVTIEIPA